MADWTLCPAGLEPSPLSSSSSLLCSPVPVPSCLFASLFVCVCPPCSTGATATTTTTTTTAAASRAAVRGALSASSRLCGSVSVAVPLSLGSRSLPGVGCPVYSSCGSAGECVVVVEGGGRRWRGCLRLEGPVPGVECGPDVRCEKERARSAHFGCFSFFSRRLRKPLVFLRCQDTVQGMCRGYRCVLWKFRTFCPMLLLCFPQTWDAAPPVADEKDHAYALPLSRATRFRNRLAGRRAGGGAWLWR